MTRQYRRVAACHPERKHCARGLCHECYNHKYQEIRVTTEGQRTASKKWYVENRDRVLAQKRNRAKEYPDIRYFQNVKYKYNTSQERYQELFGRGCWLCGEPFDGVIRPHLDHDHKCCPGKNCCGRCVRGLAHQFCNHAIAPENPTLLRKIADSLEKYENSKTAPDRGKTSSH